MTSDNYDEVYDSEQSESAGASSNEDLEQYGVWVKAGPEDVDEEPRQDEDDFELADIGDFSDTLDESDGLTSEEEDLLAGLEESEGDASTQEAQAPEDLEPGQSADTAQTQPSESQSPEDGDLEELDIDLDEDLGEALGEEDFGQEEADPSSDFEDLSLGSGDEVNLSLPDDFGDEDFAEADSATESSEETPAGAEETTAEQAAGEPPALSSAVATPHRRC